MAEKPDWIAGMVSTTLRQVVDGVAAAKAGGVTCLLPDVVAYELNVPGGTLYFEVPLEDERDILARELFQKAAKVDYSHPIRGN